MSYKMTKRKIEISRKNRNGGCKNGERHSWRIEYGEPYADEHHVYRVDTHICLKCEEVKNISHKELKAR